jgi:hypothetical protein
MKNNTSFVDFYNKHDISPVSQDISDLEKHFQKRDSLLLSLGIPALLIKGSSVIEFRAGSGQNSTYIDIEHLLGKKYIIQLITSAQQFRVFFYDPFSTNKDLWKQSICTQVKYADR